MSDLDSLRPKQTHNCKRKSGDNNISFSFIFFLSLSLIVQEFFPFEIKEKKKELSLYT